MKFSKLAMTFVAGLGLVTSVSATPISYEGQLFDGVTAYGSISGSGSDNGDWWNFYADADDVVTITGHRLEASLDPAFTLYFGLGDTDDLTYVASADDEIPEPLGLAGPYADPQLTNFDIPTTGYYSLNMWSYASGSPGSDDVWSYSLAIYGNSATVPEPSALLLLGLGLAGLGVAARQKREA